EERLYPVGLGPLANDILRQDAACHHRQRHRRLVATLSANPTQPEVRRDITDIERDDLRAPEPSEAHEGDERPIARPLAFGEQALDNLPPWYTGEPRLSTWPSEESDG